MAKLTNFIYCIGAERIPSNNGKGDAINAMGILSVLTPEFVPSTFSFSIIFSILNIDLNKNNTIQILFSKEGSQDKLVDSGTVTIPPSTEKGDIQIPDEYKGLNMSMDFRNVVLDTEGLYKTEIYFNGELLEEKPIYVKGKR